MAGVTSKALMEEEWWLSLPFIEEMWDIFEVSSWLPRFGFLADFDLDFEFSRRYCFYC